VRERESSESMTTNGLLTYFGAALFCLGAVFFVFGRLLRRPRENAWRDDKGREVPTVSKKSGELTAAQRADTLCAVILCALALVAEVASLARGGPSAGERSGNLAGAVLLIALLSLFCLGVCLVVRSRLERLLDRKDGDPHSTLKG
jgi:hypothetical protein